jgi:phosphoglycerate kinase
MKVIDDFAVASPRVLVHSDLNVPLDGVGVVDNGRIRAGLPTLTALLDHDAEVIACAHLGHLTPAMVRRRIDEQRTKR